MFFLVDLSSFTTSSINSHFLRNVGLNVEQKTTTNKNKTTKHLHIGDTPHNAGNLLSAAIRQP